MPDSRGKCRTHVFDASSLFARGIHGWVQAVSAEDDEPVQQQSREVVLTALEHIVQQTYGAARIEECGGHLAQDMLQVV